MTRNLFLDPLEALPGPLGPILGPKIQEIKEIPKILGPKIQKNIVFLNFPDLIFSILEVVVLHVLATAFMNPM